MALGGGGSGGGKAIEAGRAFVRIMGDSAPLKAALSGARRLVQGFASTISGAGNLLRGFGQRMVSTGQTAVGLGLVLATPFIAATKHFASYGDQLNKASQRTGVAVEALSELAYAAGQSGASIEDLESGIKMMQKVITGADEESKKAQKSLAMLGLTVENIVGLSPEDQFTAIADALSGVEDASRRAALAQQVFRGTQLLPLVEGGAAGLRELRREARELGVNVTKDQAEAATALGDNWDRVWATVKATAFQVGSVLAPALMEVTDRMKEGGKLVTAFVGNNRQLVLIIAGVAAGLIAAGTFLIVFGQIAIGVGATLSLFGAAIGFLTTLPGILSAVAVAGTALFLTQTQVGRSFVAEMKSGFVSFAETAKTAWGAVVQAIKGGDMQAAFAVVTTGMSLEWSKMVLFWTEKWRDFKKSLTSGILGGEGGGGGAGGGGAAGGAGNRSVFWTDLKAGMVLSMTDALRAMRIMSEEEKKRFQDDAMNVSKEVWGEARKRGETFGTEGARKDVSDARAAFEAAVKQAQQAGKTAENAAAVAAATGTAAETALALVRRTLGPQLAALPDTVKGAFQSPNFAQQFGLGDSAGKRMLDASEQTASNTKKIADKIDNPKPMTWL